MRIGCQCRAVMRRHRIPSQPKEDLYEDAALIGTNATNDTVGKSSKTLSRQATKKNLKPAVTTQEEVIMKRLHRRSRPRLLKVVAVTVPRVGPMRRAAVRTIFRVR